VNAARSAAQCAAPPRERVQCRSSSVVPRSACGDGGHPRVTTLGCSWPGAHGQRSPCTRLPSWGRRADSRIDIRTGLHTGSLVCASSRQLRPAMWRNNRKRAQLRKCAGGEAAARTANGRNCGSPPVVKPPLAARTGANATTRAHLPHGTRCSLLRHAASARLLRVCALRALQGALHSRATPTAYPPHEAAALLRHPVGRDVNKIINAVTVQRN
jgi:hypothetical protein